jgi:hypothetical protein
MITQNKVKLIRITACKRHNIAAEATQGNIDNPRTATSPTP